EPAECAVDERCELPFADGDAVPVHDRRPPCREPERDLLLLATEHAHREGAGSPEQLVERGLLADRDADEGRFERERHERGDRDAHAVAVVVYREHGHVVRHEPHQRAQVFAARHRRSLERRVRDQLCVAVGTAQNERRARRGAAELWPVTHGGRPYYLKILTARAVTSRMLSAETADSESISVFAQRLSGIASVGLNAIEFVNET